jgi:hypothetical protein
MLPRPIDEGSAAALVKEKVKQPAMVVVKRPL